ncbi:hypothetical protein KQX54_020059 [Cotesia glomerata]|uniref:Uncharacterized protein n=1 Tax=Cotesia glomerata TaxID=32391 RepID=A0AAV7IGN3_COTGL|nr:hypothetical protein KQX54_020059 [Cotesia glomerata]
MLHRCLPSPTAVPVEVLNRDPVQLGLVDPNRMQLLEPLLPNCGPWTGNLIHGFIREWDDRTQTTQRFIPMSFHNNLKD